MCGRYYIREEDSASDLQEIIDQLNRKGQTVKTGEIFPSDTMPVIANSKSLFQQVILHERANQITKLTVNG